MSHPLDATRPEVNATVHAAAGTGKTYLLVSRLIRLLLAGAEPARILAVTFTRKAATEMLDRLAERLAELASLPDAALDDALRALGETPDPALRARARRLHDRLLFSDQPLRVTTFHAFCQEILQRFPFEAGVPPGFELAEAETELRRAAWDALQAEATAAPDGPLGRCLDALLTACGSLHNLKDALGAFVDHRIDWWAFTAGADDVLAQASERATAFFGIGPEEEPLAALADPELTVMLREFVELLGRHPTDTFKQRAADIDRALRPGVDLAGRMELLCPVFLKTDGKPRLYKTSKRLLSKLGSEGAERLLELADLLAERCLEMRDRQARQRNLATTLAWYRAGQRLLDHYQRIKREQRLLDFADLEWHAYRLLNLDEHAHWVQYKLDARIDHLLVDEFQDTSPTQWRLIRPLMEELMAGNEERRRSVFLVGDAKQSIYGFRRADARLFAAAADWLARFPGTEAHGLSRSRRSARAIIDCVNRVFEHPEQTGLLADFEHHDTFHGDLFGRVELLPLVEPAEAETESAAALRDPLRRPRPERADDPHYREGQLIAHRIRVLLDSGMVIGSGEAARTLDAGDIWILLRNRTHAESYERALRDAGIPYLGTARGALLDSLEVRDLEALLTTLATPFDDLALAQVLRSPLFAVTDADLEALAVGEGRWFDRLLRHDWPADSALARAARLLGRWHPLAGALPVHDLLDRIYHEGEVLARYDAASPDSLRPRVLANLERLMDLALEVDSGRYPSLPRFLLRLGELRERAGEGPDDAVAQAGARVQFLTVHGAKGLEAPVVFLADAAGTANSRRAWQALVDWPPDAERPRWLLPDPGGKGRDSALSGLLDRQRETERREDANLLYVALTRPRQMLVVSGCRPRRGDGLGWYGMLARALDATDTLDAGEAWHCETGIPAHPAARQAPPEPEAIAPDPALSRPVAAPPTLVRLAPSRQLDEWAAEAGDADGRVRGLALHRLLELRTPPAPVEPGPARRQLAAELGLAPGHPLLDEWSQEAGAVLADPALAFLFDPAASRRAWNECPLTCRTDDGRLVDGVVDRMLLFDDRLLIVDYKTHRVDAAGAEALVTRFLPQMRLYLEAGRRLWPETPVEGALLFTHCRRLVPCTP
ncbi:UvrD-helicase domain-containing protein [Thiohalobacter sp.]|uniref:UvrD-helicase domain-containing protein n=1 Tax=Thiohalobacter sp. TaxID=2025948 RepID=UPI00261C83E6|nr:UvrD-helicase domain-containing protein [Thiohalobacter sp.]